jgi:hypothetical protein
MGQDVYLVFSFQTCLFGVPILIQERGIGGLSYIYQNISDIPVHRRDYTGALRLIVTRTIARNDFSSNASTFRASLLSSN